MRLAAGGFDHRGEDLSAHESVRLDVRYTILPMIAGIADTAYKAAFITQTSREVPIEQPPT